MSLAREPPATRAVAAHIDGTFLPGESSRSTMIATADANESDEGPSRPKFRGCVFCYSAEWAYYGAKKGIRAVRD